MNNLFNLMDMIEGIHESDNGLFTNSPFINDSRENYTHTVLESLLNLNSDVNNGNKTLYESLLEAADTQEENKIFKSYFTEFVKRFNKTILSINEAVSRFVIKIDNIADANSDILSDGSSLLDCDDFTFKKYEFKNLNNPDFPVLDPVSIYRSEFDNIGKLLQNLGPVSTNQAKLEIIASVYNSLANELKSDWVTKTMKQLTDNCGCGEMETCNFADSLYLAFRNKEAVDTVITKGKLFDIKLSMEQKDKFITSVTSTAQKLVSDFNLIIEDLSAILFGADKGKLIINTPTDGIKNASYFIDSYAENQLYLFLKSKFDQILNMANIYFIALSIKMDAIVDYYTQSEEIIKFAYGCNYINSKPDITGFANDLDDLNNSLEDLGDLLDDLNNSLDDLEPKDDTDDDIDLGIENFSMEESATTQSSKKQMIYTDTYASQCSDEDLYRSINYEIFEIMVNYDNQILYEQLALVLNEADEDDDYDPDADPDTEEEKDKKDDKESKDTGVNDEDRHSPDLEKRKAYWKKVRETDGPFWKIIHYIQEIFERFFRKCGDRVSGSDKNNGQLEKREDVVDNTIKINNVQTWFDKGYIKEPIASLAEADREKPKPGKGHWLPAFHFERINDIEIPKLVMPKMKDDGDLDDVEKFLDKYASYWRQSGSSKDVSDFNALVTDWVVDYYNGEDDIAAYEKEKDRLVGFILTDYKKLINGMHLMQSEIDAAANEAKRYTQMVIDNSEFFKDFDQGNLTNVKLDNNGQYNPVVKPKTTSEPEKKTNESFEYLFNKAFNSEYITERHKEKPKSKAPVFQKIKNVISGNNGSNTTTSSNNNQANTNDQNNKTNNNQEAQTPSTPNVNSDQKDNQNNTVDNKDKIAMQNAERLEAQKKAEKEKEKSAMSAEAKLAKEYDEANKALMNFFNGCRRIINAKAVAINHAFDMAYYIIESHSKKVEGDQANQEDEGDNVQTGDGQNKVNALGIQIDDNGDPITTDDQRKTIDQIMKMEVGVEQKGAMQFMILKSKDLSINQAIELYNTNSKKVDELEKDSWYKGLRDEYRKMARVGFLIDGTIKSAKANVQMMIDDENDNKKEKNK